MTETRSRLLRLHHLFRRIRGGPSARFLGQSAIYGVGRAVSQMANVLLLPLYLTQLAPAQYGILAVSQMISPVLTALWTFGLEAAIGRFYYEYEGVERERVVATVFTLVRGLSVIGLFATLLVGPWLFPRLIYSAPYQPHIQIVIWTAFFNSFAVLPLLLMRMREEAHKYALATILTLGVTAGATLYLLLVLELGVVGVLLGNLAGSIVAAIGYLWYLRRSFTVAPDWKYARRSFRYVLPMLPELMLGNLVQAADRFLLDKWVAPSSIGLYSLARQIGGLTQQVIQSLKTAYTPMGFRIWLQDGTLRVNNLRRISLWFFAISCIMAVAIILFSWEVLATIARQEYLGAVPMVPFAVLTGVILAAYYILVMNFLLSDRVQPLAWIFAIYAGSLLAMGVGLISWVGVWGAIVAALVAMLLRTVFAYLLGESRLPLGLPVYPLMAISLPVAILVPLGLGDWDGTADLARWAGKTLILVGYGVLTIAFVLWETRAPPAHPSSGGILAGQEKRFLLRELLK